MNSKNLFFILLSVFFITPRLHGAETALAHLIRTASEIHRDSLVVDGHNDLPWALRSANDLDLHQHDLSKPLPQFHTDIPRLRKGGVGAQFWSVYVPSNLMDDGTAFQVTKEQIQLVKTMVDKYSGDFSLALTANDIVQTHKKGKIASLIGMEGGHSIENSLSKLNELYQLGARYMTLTHWRNLDWIEASTDKPMTQGLTKFGEKVIQAMNQLGMFIDISHISARAMREVLKVTQAPVIASHSSADAIRPHVRNIPDDVLKMIKDNRGVVMVNFYSEYLTDKTVPRQWNHSHLKHRHQCVEEDLKKWERTSRIPQATVSTLVDHIDHIVKVAGIDSVGLGSDFDGVPVLPVGLEDVSKFPNITIELLKRGYPKEDIKKILGLNLVRAMKEMESVATRGTAHRS